MAKIVVDKELCKGCGLCVRACPKKILSLSKHANSKGYHPAELSDMDACVGCASCAVSCPDMCIEVYK